MCGQIRYTSAYLTGDNKVDIIQQSTIRSILLTLQVIIKVP